MPPPGMYSGRTRPTKPKKQARAQKRKREDVDVEKLEQAVAELVGRMHAETYAVYARVNNAYRIPNPATSKTSTSSPSPNPRKPD